MANHRLRSAHAPARFVLAALGALALASCEKKDDASRPSGIPAMATNPVAAAPLPTPPPAPQPPPSAAPSAAPEAPPAPEAPIDPKAAISGTIVLPASRKANVSPGDTIWLVARRIADNPGARGSLVAAKRLAAARFPMPFTLSARDMMIQTGAFDGVVTLSVRVDKLGDPMNRHKGDVIGGLPKVSVGARNVKLVLDQLQKEDESLAGNAPPMAGAAMGSAPMMNPHGGMDPRGGMDPHGELPPGHPQIQQ